MPDSTNLTVLKEKIKLLEKENSLLTEHTEDTLMLGLISEAIEQTDDITCALDSVLERISMLKNIPVISYCEVHQGIATTLQSYVAFMHAEVNGFSFALPDMEDDAVFMAHHHSSISQLHMPSIHFIPKQALVVPIASRKQGVAHVFLFASNEHGNYLQRIQAILQRVVYIISIVMDNRNLLKSYKELNEELDYRVELRSKALQESEHKYQTLVENSDTAIMLLSDDKFVECNVATLRMFACASKEEFLKLSPVSVSPEFQSNGIDSISMARQEIELAMEKGSNRFDWVHKRNNGEEFFAEVHLTRVLIQGQVMIQAVVIDIHERVLAEKKLHQYKHIVSSSLDMMAILDENYIYLATNPAYLQALNQRSENVVGHSILDVFGGELFRSTIQPYAKMCLKGDVVHFQKWLELPAYGLRCMDIHFYPYRNRSGKIIGFVVNGRDNTKQVQMQKELQKSESKYRELIDHMQDCVYRTDAEGRLVYASPAIQTLMKGKLDELIGEKLSDYYVDPNGREKFLSRLKASADGTINSFEVQVRRKDGEIIWLSANSHFIYDEEDHIQGVEGSLREITKLKEMELKFNQAQKMEAVGTLVGGIAHDFNNILAGMVGSFYLMKYKQKNNPELVQDIEVLEEQSFRAADMIKQLLSFCRKGEIDKKDFSFVLLIQEVFKLAERTIPENISLQLNVCKDALFINGDASLLQQVLMNLINNSRDAVSDVEKPKINVSIHSFMADEAFIQKHPEIGLETLYARLSIQDNGYGIAKEDLSHVFEPFYTTKAVGEGTGLGLAMIYGSIQSHQGFIEINSMVNQGTTVDVFLPLVASDTHEEHTTSPTNISKGHGELILCVDDEADICAVSSEILTSFGYQTLQASDGLEAIKIFEQYKDKIALVLTDVVMPNMGGVELANKLWLNHPKLPVVFITGYDESNLLDVSDRGKHTCVLEKPFTIDGLNNHVHDLLEASLT